MNLENLVAVSGLSGLFRLVANRSNGLIVEDLADGKRRFASARKHQFTPLESIGIYTDDGDSTELKNVFRNMLDQQADNPPVDPEAAPEELRSYFADVLPTYDRDRVHVGDMRKVVKWFHYLQGKGLLADNPAADSETEAAQEEE